MQIAKDAVVRFDYTLTDPAGKTLDTSAGRGPLAYLHGRGGIIAGLERAMEGRSAEEAFKVTIPAAEAYGEHQAGLVAVVPRAEFQPGQMIFVGQPFQATDPNGRKLTVRVSKLDAQTVTLDANHPLAGVALTFDVKVIEVRPATEEELAHGHPHGPGGHQH